MPHPVVFVIKLKGLPILKVLATNQTLQGIKRTTYLVII